MADRLNFERLKKIFSKGRYIKFIVIAGICGIVMIFASGFSEKPDKTVAETESGYDTDLYIQKNEERLRNILENIDGVGKAEIMLTVSCTEEYVYAEEIKSDVSQDGDRKTVQNENQYVFSGNSSDKKALVKKVVSPEISGVVIVCEGGDRSRVAESIYQAVSTAFDIPSSRIYVARIK